MEIMKNVVREKIRKKMLYVATALGILVMAVFSSDMGSITIGGKSVNDYYVLLPILMNVMNFLAGAIALAVSCSTIPLEYERRTSHLIWSRGVSQARYHMDLTAGNIAVAWISGAILYIALAVFSILKGYEAILGKIVLAAFFMMLYTAIICILTSALSIKLPTVFTITVMVFILVCGAFRDALILLMAAITGPAGAILKRAVRIIPDLSGISKQAGNLIQDKPVNAHVIIIGFLMMWIGGLLILLIKREEA